jgi:aminoglycoside 6'-N-acetyltransferase I
VIVVPATHTKAHQWLEMRRALWPDEDQEQLQIDVARYFAGNEPNLVQVLLALDERGRALGFAELNIRPYAEGCETDRVAYLEGWYVVPGARRTGVGAALIRAAEDWGRTHGCTEFASDALLENEVSEQAHKALGFREVERIRCFMKKL